MSQQTDLLIFGAKGDLAIRKLFPALLELDKAGLLDDGLRIFALARGYSDLENYLKDIHARIIEERGTTYCSNKEWRSFSARFVFLSMDFSNLDDYARLATHLEITRCSIFYLATPPGLFSSICENLHQAECINETSRVVLEKPIGHDLASSIEVNSTLANYFSESNIYRIDHYLGKETVQNLLVLRFANRFINAQWDQSCIDHVQITVAETVGIGDRWPYFNPVGQLRDMVQNHIMQLLCLVAMEPPNKFNAESIRNEKLKIVSALRPIEKRNASELSIRGQYSQGVCDGKLVPGYLDEKPCQDPTSNTETFVAIKAHIDNWRWSGVPFYIRTGKRMAKKLTEIVIVYHKLPHNIFHGQEEGIPNKLVIRLQPNEGIEMQMLSKVHSFKEKMTLVKQDLNLDFLRAGSNDRIPDAYERLLLDVIEGDQSLFVGREEVEGSWRWCDSLINAWQASETRVKPYYAGSWGPTKADLLIERDGRKWHE